MSHRSRSIQHVSTFPGVPGQNLISRRREAGPQCSEVAFHRELGSEMWLKRFIPLGQGVLYGPAGILRVELANVSWST
jgi:hypothetical protein